MSRVTTADFEDPDWTSTLSDEFIALCDLSPSERLRRDIDDFGFSKKAPKGLPCHAVAELLHLFIRPQVHFIQAFVDPGFKLSQFQALDSEERQVVREAVRRVLEQLVRLPPPLPPERGMLIKHRENRRTWCRLVRVCCWK